MGDKDIYLDILNEHSEFFNYKKELETHADAFQKEIDLYFERDHVFDINIYTEAPQEIKAQDILQRSGTAADDQAKGNEQDKTQLDNQNIDGKESIFDKYELSDVIASFITTDIVRLILKFVKENSKNISNVDDTITDNIYHGKLGQAIGDVNGGEIERYLKGILSLIENTKLASAIKNNDFENIDKDESLSKLGKRIANILYGYGDAKTAFNKDIQNRFQKVQRHSQDKDKAIDEFLMSLKGVVDKFLSDLKVHPKELKDHPISREISRLYSAGYANFINQMYTDFGITGNTKELANEVIKKITGKKVLNIEGKKESTSFKNAIDQLTKTGVIDSINKLVSDEISTRANTFDTMLSKVYKEFQKTGYYNQQSDEQNEEDEFIQRILSPYKIYSYNEVNMTLNPSLDEKAISNQPPTETKDITPNTPTTTANTPEKQNVQSTGTLEKAWQGIQAAGLPAEKHRQEATRLVIAFTITYVFAIIIELLNDQLTNEADKEITEEVVYNELLLDAIKFIAQPYLDVLKSFTAMPLSFADASSKISSMLPKLIESLKNNQRFISTFSKLGLNNVANDLDKRVFNEKWLKENKQIVIKTINDIKPKIQEYLNKIDEETFASLIKQVYQPTKLQKTIGSVVNKFQQLKEKGKY